MHPFINSRLPRMWHGGDYNPDQWQKTPEVWDEDIRMMKLAGCNVASVGIFSWMALEPSEGRFNFDWLDRILDKMAANGIYALLATPSGAKPVWLSEKYPEIRRMNADGVRDPHRRRHNHCRTSPVYRAHCARINTVLAKRYAQHPALLAWHVSNEYNGVDCHCPLCHAAFQSWLKKRYNNDIDALNHAWWTGFWSHTYTSWEQILPVDASVHGLMIDWSRFKSDQTIDFFKEESAPLRRITPDTPITTNFMGFHETLDYWKFAREVDVVSWDSYPPYHDLPGDWLLAVDFSFVAAMNRSFKQKPFILMESTPSVQNHKPVNKLKRPGVLPLEAMQYVSHGADSVQYFQWRKSRGGCEKFHGAVVDHCGHEHTRVFGEVAQVGRLLSTLSMIPGTSTPSEVAIMYDWENRWAIDNLSGYSRDNRNYPQTCTSHYQPFWSSGVPCDIVNEDSDFSGYKLLIAPMMYMIRPGVAERIKNFVRDGGTFVTTYLSGIADESDLCFLGGMPGPLRDVMGIWVEETDTLYPEETVKVAADPAGLAGLSGTYDARIFCDLLHPQGAQVLATYASEFYAGRPALTVNQFGKGRAYYIASRNDDRFHTDFYRRLIQNLQLQCPLGVSLPQGVTAQVRTNGRKDYIFVLNFKRDPVKLTLPAGAWRDIVSNTPLSGELNLAGYGHCILETDRQHASCE